MSGGCTGKFRVFVTNINGNVLSTFEVDLLEVNRFWQSVLNLYMISSLWNIFLKHVINGKIFDEIMIISPTFPTIYWFAMISPLLWARDVSKGRDGEDAVFPPHPPPRGACGSLGFSVLENGCRLGWRSRLLITIPWRFPGSDWLQLEGSPGGRCVGAARRKSWWSVCRCN